jgi:transmembrane sensor
MSGQNLQVLFPRTAEEWLIRMHAPDCSRQEHDAFHDWLRADPKHRVAYEKCEKVWMLPEAIRKDSALLADALALGPSQGRPVAAPRPWLQPGYLSLAATLVLALGVLLVSELRGLDRGSITTADAEQAKVTLADGTQVHLNPRTRLVWHGSDTARHVSLEQGEAFFSVTKDNGRPFIVKAGEVEVRVVGTEFSVRRKADDLEVVVREGQVDVLSTQRSNALEPARVELHAGKRLRINPAQGQVVVSSVDADRVTAWRNGSLEFDADTLSHVVTEVNRFSRKQLEIADPNLRDLQISGRFEIGDVEGLAFNLRERFGIRSDEISGRIVLRGP